MAIPIPSPPFRFIRPQDPDDVIVSELRSGSRLDDFRGVVIPSVGFVEIAVVAIDGYIFVDKVGRIAVSPFVREFGDWFAFEFHLIRSFLPVSGDQLYGSGARSPVSASRTLPQRQSSKRGKIKAYAGKNGKGFESTKD